VNTCVSVLRKHQSYYNSLHVSPYFTSLHIVHVTFLKLARHLIIAISLQISTSLSILIRTDAASGMVFTMNIYRTFQTVSSHPAPRVNECPHRNVTSVDAVSPCAPFVSKDAIVPKCSEDRTAVIKHDIRMTVHTLRCVLCVCVWVC